MVLTSKLCSISRLSPLLRCLRDGFGRLANAHQFRRSFASATSDGDEDELDLELDDLLKDEEYEDIVPASLRPSNSFHQEVFLIQPRTRWGKKRYELLKTTTPELQLAEAVALVETLPNWRVCEKLVAPTDNMDKLTMFGRGTLETLVGRVRSGPATNVVMGVNVLRGEQQTALEEHFGCPVLDRYAVVLQIFNSHAKSRESRLQIALAEIPYIRSRLREFCNKRKDRARKSGMTNGESFIEQQRRILNERSQKIQKALDRLKQKRQLLRERRRRLQIPTVAVVGYTNSGKTSLIKCLTKDESLLPQNHLFATLDVTVHSGSLPHLKQVLYVDTVGFIAHIPTALIQAFVATLAEVTLADVIVHVQDISHPDAKGQNETVIRTLRQDIQVDERLSQNMLVVGNKVDLIDDETSSTTAAIVKPDLLISVTEGTNIEQLKVELEKRLIASTGRLFRTFRVPSGGAEYHWLHRESSVTQTLVCPVDSNYTLVTTVVNEAAFGRFRRNFGLECLVKEEQDHRGREPAAERQ